MKIYFFLLRCSKFMIGNDFYNLIFIILYNLFLFINNELK